MHAVDRLLSIMARLRDPEGGCPWDLEQDFASIAPHTLEEAYEVDDAIARGDFEALREELGDLLLQVVFHAQMARERGLFDFEAVAETLSEKLVRRHPHVYGDAAVATATKAFESWRHASLSRRTKVLFAYRELVERHKLELARVPVAFQGLPIAFTLAGLFALAFMGFSGLSFLR